MQVMNDQEAFDALSYEQLTAKARHVRRIWPLLNEQHQAVLERIDEQEEIDAAGLYITQMEDWYIEVEARLEARLTVLKRAREPAPVQPQQQRIIVNQPREPKVGTFDGRHENWAAFADLFRVEVHERQDMEPVEKLVHLKAACVDTAQKALGNWPTVGDNYELAWASLRSKYNDPYAMKNRLLADVFRMPKQHEETHDGLRMLQDTPQVALQQLQAMGERTEFWDLFIMQTIMRRAPRKVAEAWENARNQDEQPTLQQMYAWLDKRARGRMVAEATMSDRARAQGKGDRANNKPSFGHNGQPKDNGQPGRNNNREQNNQPRQGWQSNRQNDHQPVQRSNEHNAQRPAQYNGQPGPAAEQNNQRGGGNRPFACWICGGSHTMFDCDVLRAKNASDRVIVMTEKGVCTACARKHGNKPCESPRICALCDGAQHHDIVCPKKVPDDKAPPQHNRTLRKRKFDQ